MTHVWYFGCPDGQIGHYFQGPGYGADVPEDKRRSRLHSPYECPWQEVDGVLPPKCDEQPQGLVRVVRKAGWTALAWWDRSQDGRPNSNSCILIDADVTYQEGLRIAREAFPFVFTRISYDLRRLLSIGECPCGSTKYRDPHYPHDHAGWSPED